MKRVAVLALSTILSSQSMAATSGIANQHEESLFSRISKLSQSFSGSNEYLTEFSQTADQSFDQTGEFVIAEGDESVDLTIPPPNPAATKAQNPTTSVIPPQIGGRKPFVASQASIADLPTDIPPPPAPTSATSSGQASNLDIPQLQIRNMIAQEQQQKRKGGGASKGPKLNLQKKQYKTPPTEDELYQSNVEDPLKPNPHRKPKLNYKTHHQQSPLYTKRYSSKNKHLPSVAYENEYKQILFDSAAIGQLDILRSLVDYFDNTDVRDAEGNTPLLYAIMANNQTSATTLLHMGANPNITNNNRVSPLYVAISTDRLALATLLLFRGAEPSALGPDGQTLLMSALAKNNMHMAYLLLRHDANIDQQAITGDTALHTSLRLNNNNFLYALLKRGANTEIRNNKQHTPLMLAAYTGNAQAVELLLEAGASGLATNRHGYNAMQIAAARGFADIAIRIETINIERQLMGQELMSDPESELDHVLPNPTEPIIIRPENNISSEQPADTTTDTTTDAPTVKPKPKAKPKAIKKKPKKPVIQRVRPITPPKIEKPTITTEPQEKPDTAPKAIQPPAPKETKDQNNTDTPTTNILKKEITPPPPVITDSNPQSDKAVPPHKPVTNDSTDKKNDELQNNLKDFVAPKEPSLPAPTKEQKPPTSDTKDQMPIILDDFATDDTIKPPKEVPSVGKDPKSDLYFHLEHMLKQSEDKTQIPSIQKLKEQNSTVDSLMDATPTKKKIDKQQVAPKDLTTPPPSSTEEALDENIMESLVGKLEQKKQQAQPDDDTNTKTQPAETEKSEAQKKVEVETEAPQQQPSQSTNIPINTNEPLNLPDELNINPPEFNEDDSENGDEELIESESESDSEFEFNQNLEQTEPITITEDPGLEIPPSEFDDSELDEIDSLEQEIENDNPLDEDLDALLNNGYVEQPENNDTPELAVPPLDE